MKSLFIYSATFQNAPQLGFVVKWEDDHEEEFQTLINERELFEHYRKQGWRLFNDPEGAEYQSVITSDRNKLLIKDFLIKKYSNEQNDNRS